MSDNKSAAALEREAEAVRSQVADTAESLRDKMSPGQMIDEVKDYFSNSDGSVALNNLKAQVRDNPLPLALIGAGLAWFFLGGGPSVDRLSKSRSYGYSGYDDDDDFDDFPASTYTDDDWDGSGMDALGGVSSGADRSYAGGSYEGSGRRGGPGKSSKSGTLGSMASGVTDAAGNVASAVSDAAGSAYSAIGDAAAAVSDAASSATGSAASAASMVGRRASRTGRMVARRSSRVGRKVQDGYLDILSREPLVLGAVGLAVGAAIGAMLPSTEYENENIGPYRDRLRDEAEKRVHDGIDEAKDAARDVAKSTYQAAKDEADRQGLVPGSEDSLVGRVAKVASSAAATAEKQVRDKIEPEKSGS